MAETAFQHPETELVLGYGPMDKVPGMLNRWARFETAHTAMQYFSFARAGMPYMGVGRNLAFKKTTFERMGGYSSHLHIPSGDDDLLVNAVGTKGNTAICAMPESFVFFSRPNNLEAMAQAKTPAPGRLNRLPADTSVSARIAEYFAGVPLLFSTDFAVVRVSFTRIICRIWAAHAYTSHYLRGRFFTTPMCGLAPIRLYT
jgi:hypothetical protein